MSEPTTARPAQVTLAGWVVVVASVIVVVSVFDQLGNLRTDETRQAISTFLSQPPGDGLGLGVDSVVGLLRATAMAAAALAAASAVLGWFVLRRDRVARVVLTVLAVPLFLTGLASGGFFPAVVAGSSLMLWAQPARDWFDGRRTTDPAAKPANRSATQETSDRRTEPRAPIWPPPSTPSAPSDPGPTGVNPPAGPPAPSGPSAWAGPSAWGAPLPTTSSATPPPSLIARRPDSVLWACLVTWVFSGVTMVGLAISGLLLFRDGTQVIEDARASNPGLVATNVDDSVLLAGVAIVLAGMVGWAIVAMVLAVLVWRGRDWARLTLVASSGVAAGVGLLAVVGSSFFTLPLVIACGATLRMLLSRRAAAWCRRPAPRLHRPGVPPLS